MFVYHSNVYIVSDIVFIACTNFDVFVPFLSLIVYRLSVSDVARRLVDLCGSKLVAITDGSRGSVLATRENVSTINKAL